MKYGTARRASAQERWGDGNKCTVSHRDILDKTYARLEPVISMGFRFVGIDLRNGIMLRPLMKYHRVFSRFIANASTNTSQSGR